MKGGDFMIEFERGKQGYITKNFRYSEFECKCGKCKSQKINSSIVAFAQQIRDYFGKPVIVNSGYRCREHNVKVGGVSKSQHVNGNALDIVVKNVSPIEVAKYCETIGIKGIGVYQWGCHIDTRDTKSFWKNDNCIPITTFLPKMGSVEFLQSLLNFKYGENLVVDGVFGPKTETAVLKHFAK